MEIQESNIIKRFYSTKPYNSETFTYTGSDEFTITEGNSRTIVFEYTSPKNRTSILNEFELMVYPEIITPSTNNFILVSVFVDKMPTIGINELLLPQRSENIETFVIIEQKKTLRLSFTFPSDFVKGSMDITIYTRIRGDLLQFKNLPGKLAALE